MPVLIANPTGTRAVPDMSSLRNQCDSSNPGAVKSTRVAAKATRGKASERPLRGKSRITAAALKSKTSASGEFRRATLLLRSDDPPGDRAFTGMPHGPETFPSAKASILSPFSPERYLAVLPGGAAPAVRYK